MNRYIISLIFLQRKHERECQRLQKEAEDKQKLYLDWARCFEVKSGGEWRQERMVGNLYHHLDVAS